MFCHFGINTFFGKEWSDGSLPPSGFCPTDFNPRQWVETAKEAGMKYLVLTAKHHDGFCLWPTDTTDYSVRSSPWKNGDGDIVGETAEACRAAGLPFGLYLSPWDRHEACYPDPDAYDDFYCSQLTELCTRYGPLFEIWFDGAGSEGRVYDWDRIMGVASGLQPRAMIFNMGRPTIRWAGNENGIIEDPVRYVVNTTKESAFVSETATVGNEDFRYLPPECDVAIRQNWFWQPDDLDTLKTPEHLLAVWYHSVGMGANLLLNVPPDRRGLLDVADVRSLLSMAGELDKRFSTGEEHILQRVPAGYEFTSRSPFDHVEIFEDLEAGQTISGFRLKDANDGRLLSEGLAIGVRRMQPCPTVSASRLLLEIDGPGPVEKLRTYHTGHSERPTLPGKLDYREWARKADLPS